MSQNGANKPILTISMLVSNRPKTIRKSLDSLKPIMEQLDCELILVDTSGSEEIHKMLLEYTDQVPVFAWCDDFAKARNVGLSRAHGEWFLYLDDDEWFTETDELVDFFQSGEYRKYHRADYIQRNYYDGYLTYYSDSWVSRMIRIEADTHFESKIHEYMAPARGLCKEIHAVVDHTGYVFQKYEDQLRHFERNSKLLLEMIEEQPENLRWKVQLAQEYRSIKKWEELYTFSAKCLDETAAVETPWKARDIGTFYVGAVEGLLYLGQNEKAEEYAKRGMEDRRMGSLTRAHLRQQLGVAYYREGRLEESEQVIAEYFQDYEYLRAHEAEWTEQKGTLLVEEAFDMVEVKRAYSILCCDGLRRSETANLKKYYDKLEWEKKVIYVCDDFVPALLSAMSSMPFEEIFARVWKDAWKNPDLREQFTTFIVESRDSNRDAFMHIMRIVSEADLEDPYTVYASLLWAEKEKDIGRIDRCIRTKPAAFLEQTLPQAFEQLERAQLIYFERVCDENDFSDRLRGTLFLVLLAQGILVKSGSGVEYAELRRRIAGFSSMAMEFLGKYYRTETMEEYTELLPKYGQVAVTLARALEMEQDDSVGALRLYRDAVVIDSAYAAVISAYMRLFGEENSPECRKAKLDELRGKLLAEVYAGIRRREYETAFAILAELKRTDPGDLETAQLALETRLAYLKGSK